MEQSQPKKRRATKDASNDRLNEIARNLSRHVGKPAILFVKESREFVPYFGTLTSNGLVYPCYSPEGKFRCMLHQHVSAIDVLTEHQQIIFFDDGI